MPNSADSGLVAFVCMAFVSRMRAATGRNRMCPKGRTALVSASADNGQDARGLAAGRDLDDGRQSAWLHW